MSRPFRFLLPAVLLVGALGFTGCVGTIYDNMYSNRKNHFRAPEEKKEVSAESLLGNLDSRRTEGAGADAGALPPAAGGADIPGLPPAGLPDAGAAPAAPAAPAPAAPPQ